MSWYIGNIDPQNQKRVDKCRFIMSQNVYFLFTLDIFTQIFMRYLTEKKNPTSLSRLTSPSSVTGSVCRLSQSCWIEWGERGRGEWVGEGRGECRLSECECSREWPGEYVTWPHLTCVTYEFHRQRFEYEWRNSCKIKCKICRMYTIWRLIWRINTK